MSLLLGQDFSLLGLWVFLLLFFVNFYISGLVFSFSISRLQSKEKGRRMGASLMGSDWGAGGDGSITGDCQVFDLI